MPLLARQQQKRKADAIVHANAPQQQQHQLSEPRHRPPYLLKMLQDGLGTRVLTDTLDWDGELSVHFAPPTRARGPPPLARGGNCEKDLKFLFFYFFFIRRYIS
jgi:hypothetical protein